MRAARPLFGLLAFALGCASGPTTVRLTIEAAPSVTVEMLRVRVTVGERDGGIERDLPQGGQPELPGTLLIHTPDSVLRVGVVLVGTLGGGAPFEVADAIETQPHRQVVLTMLIGSALPPDGGDAAQPNDLSGSDQAIAGPYNYMFVTSTTYTGGQIGGLAGGDAICQARAAAAGLPGTYRAWLSSSTVSAKSHLGTANGWVRPDGLPFALSLEALTTDYQVLYPPRIDERGNNVEGIVLTGTGPNGLPRAETCSDWTSDSGSGAAVGYAEGGPLYWSAPDPYKTACTGPARLYCFGIDHSAPLTLTPAAGRLAFITKNVYPIDPSGIMFFDQACAAEATAAALLGSFRAFVTPTGTSAISRFNLSGPAWVRTDGIAIVRQAADLADGQLLASISVLADGKSYVPRNLANNVYAWAGARSPSAPGDSAWNCADWTTAGSGQATTGLFGMSSSPYFGYWVNMWCGGQARLYCLQE